jgi:hypothetical protein
VGGGLANFGWSNVWFAEWVYALFLTLVLLAAVALGITAWRALRTRARPSRRAALTGLLLLITSGALLFGLHWTDFHMYLRSDPPFLQGRYLLPLAPIFALLLTQATRAVPRRFQPALQGAVLAGLVVLQIACLGLVASRYYG